MKVVIFFKDKQREIVVVPKAKSCEPDGLWVRIILEDGTNALYASTDIDHVEIVVRGAKEALG